MDDLSRNLEIARSEEQIGMRCRATEMLISQCRWNTRKSSPEWIANDEKRNVFRRCVAQDFIALKLYHVAICKDELLAIECFLARM